MPSRRSTSSRAPCRKYALFSLARITIAYFISLVVTLVYGYVAAHNARAERILIPLLDTLQSIPVLSFLPGVMVAMVALVPHPATGRGTGFDPADLHRPGLEHDVQRVLLDQEHPARAAGGGSSSIG